MQVLYQIRVVRKNSFAYADKWCNFCCLNSLMFWPHLKVKFKKVYFLMKHTIKFFFGVASIYLKNCNQLGVIRTDVHSRLLSSIRRAPALELVLLSLESCRSKQFEGPMQIQAANLISLFYSSHRLNTLGKHADSRVSVSFNNLLSRGRRVRETRSRRRRYRRRECK